MVENLGRNSNSRREHRRYASRTRRLDAIAAGAGLLLLCAVVYVPPAVLTPFFTKGEPREALVVRRMVEQGDWILPKRSSENGWTIASKPPFFHWLAALTSEVAGGIGELSVRAPSLALGSATVLLVWIVGRRWLSPTAALGAAVVLATTFEWVRAVSSARVDATLTALMAGALLLFWGGIGGRGLPLAEAVPAYVLLACAALTKGPVGCVLPGLVLVIALVLGGEIRLLPRFRPILGAMIVLTIAGGWYLVAWRLGGDPFVRKHILKENVFRFLAAATLKSGHVHAFYYYLPTFAAGFLPWTPFLVAALVAALRDPIARADARVRFLLVWIGVVFLFYSAASAKRSVYLLALYPAAALLTGWWWARLAASARGPRWLSGRLAQLTIFITAVVLMLPLGLVIAEAAGLAPIAHLGPLLHPKDQANLPLVAAIIDQLLPATLAALTVMVAALMVALVALRRNDWRRLFIATAVLAVGLWTTVFAIFQPALAERRTLAPFLAEVTERVAGDPLYFYPGTFDFGAAFYAPVGTRHWRAGQRHGEPVYLLVWEDETKTIDVDSAAVEVLATSEGTDPKGVRHLSLVRLH